MNGTTGLPTLDILLRRMGIAPATLRDERAPQAVISNFARRPGTVTADGRPCTLPLACSRLIQKTVQIVQTFPAQNTVQIEVSIPTGADDRQLGANTPSLWVPLILGIAASGIFTLQQGSCEVTIQAVRIATTTPQMTLGADLQAFIAGLWTGPGPYCPRVAPYNLGGS